LAGGEFGEERNGALEAESKWQKAVRRRTIDDGRIEGRQKDNNSSGGNRRMEKYV
jgi:hypothetical protein